MINKTFTTTLTATLLALVLTVQAGATVILGFEINSVSPLPLFNATAGDTTTITDDTLTADSNVDLTITIDGAPIPTFNDAAFRYDATLNSVTQQGSYLIMSYAGSFSFSENGTDATIVSGTFNNMQLTFLAPGGNILFPVGLTASTPAAPRIFNSGFALNSFLPANTFLGGKQTINFTVDLFTSDNLATYIASTQNGLVPTGDATFSSSLSATSQTTFGGDIPEPATISVALLGLALMIKRRRTA